MAEQHVRSDFENTPETRHRHQAAARSCDASRALGLAPAMRGQPGYWPHLDADRDGVACEPWLGRSWWTRPLW
jgi:hypothetical protein